MEARVVEHSSSSTSTGIGDYADRLPLVYRDLDDVAVKFSKEVRSVKVHTLKKPSQQSLNEKSTDQSVVFLIHTVDYILLLRVDTEKSETFRAYQSFSEGCSLLLNDASTKFLLTVPLLMIYDYDREDQKVNIAFDPTTLYRGRYGGSGFRRTMRSIFKDPHAKDTELQQLVVEFGDSQVAGTFHSKLAGSLSRMTLAVHWLTSELPLDDSISTVAATYQQLGKVQDANSRLLSYNMEFGDGIQLPECWDQRVQEGDRGHALCIYIHCPLGPVLASMTPSQFRVKAGGKNQAIFKIVGQPTAESYVSANGLSRLARSMQTINRSTTSRKFVTLHCKASVTQGKPQSGDWFATPDGGTPFQTASSGDLLAAEKEKGKEKGKDAARAELWDGPRMLVPLVALALLTWIMSGAGYEAGVAILEALVLLLVGLFGLQKYLIPSRKGSSQEPVVQMRPLVNSATVKAVQRWTVTVIEAEMIEIPLDGMLVSAEMESKMSNEDLIHSNFTSRMSMQKAPISVDLAPEFEELSREYSYASPDMINRYMTGFQSSATTAYNNLMATIEWRKAEGIDTITEQPMPTYWPYKEYCPVSFYAVTKDGFPVVILPLGKFFTMYDKVKAAGVTDADRVRFLTWVQEWVYNKLDTRPNPGGRVIFVADAKGTAMSHLFSTYMDHLKSWGVVLQHNYVERLKKAVVINAPSWTNVAWKVASTMMNEVTKSRISVSPGGKKTTEALLEILPEDKIPQEYGGKCPAPIGESEYDLQVQQHLKKLEAAAKA